MEWSNKHKGATKVCQKNPTNDEQLFTINYMCIERLGPFLIQLLQGIRGYNVSVLGFNYYTLFKMVTSSNINHYTFARFYWQFRKVGRKKVGRRWWWYLNHNCLKSWVPFMVFMCYWTWGGFGLLLFTLFSNKYLFLEW